MERYYYHGFDHLNVPSSINFMINILTSGGLKTRNEVGEKNDNSFNHVCLYRKAEDYDYDDPNVYDKSSRYSWIDKCMVFVISPAIKAEKKETSYIDEWRSIGDIPNSMIVGIALPFSTIYKYSSYAKGKEKEDFELSLKKLIDVASQLGLSISNSDEENFTDKLDEQLNKKTMKL